MDALSRLLHATEVGDRAAFAKELSADLALLQKHAQHLMSSQLSAFVTPEDLVQDALADAWDFLTKGGKVTQGSPAAWLRAVLANVVSEAARRHLLTQKRCPAPASLSQACSDTPSDSGGTLVDALPAPDTSPSSGAARNHMAARVPQLLARLPADRRQVLQLMYFEGRSKAEVADILGRTEEATRKLLGRAIAEFAVLLAAGDRR